MTTGEYKIEKSRKYKGLWLLTGTVITDGGVRLPCFRAYFESHDAAVFHARTMMFDEGDTLSDETGLLERGSKKERRLTDRVPGKNLEPEVSDQKGKP